MTAPPVDDAEEERRRLLHEVNNRLAAVLMNVAFARTTLEASSRTAPLTPVQRADLTVAMEHAEVAANHLAVLLREL